MDHSKEQADRRGARGVGHDQQHLLAGEAEGRERLATMVAHLGFGEAEVGETGADYCVSWAVYRGS